MLRSIWRLYIYGNVHIAICAVLFAAAGYRFVHAPLDLSYFCFVFFSTVFGYNLHRFYSNKFVVYGLAERVDFLASYKSKSKWYLAVMALATLISFNALPSHYYPPCLILGLVTMAYLTPIKNKRLRDMPYVKIFLVGLCWMGIFLIPVNIATSQHEFMLWSLGAEKTFFIIALTIPFDWRDVEIDHSSGVKTIASFSRLTSKKILALLIMMAILIVWLLGYLRYYSLELIVALTIFYLVQWYLCLRAEKQSELYHLAVLDGLIGIHGLIFLLLLI